MSVHNHLLFISISCNMSLLSRCIIGHPNRVNLTSLSRGNQFHCSIKGAYNCIHPGIRPLFLSPRRLHLCAKKKKKKKKKNVFHPSVPLCHLSGDLLFGYDLVLLLDEFLAPPLLKITNCLVLSLLI